MMIMNGRVHDLRYTKISKNKEEIKDIYGNNVSKSGENY